MKIAILSSLPLPPHKAVLKLSPLSPGAREYFFSTYGRPFPHPYKLKKPSLPLQPYQEKLPFKDSDFYEEFSKDELLSFKSDSEKGMSEKELSEKYYTKDVLTTMTHIAILSYKGEI